MRADCIFFRDIGMVKMKYKFTKNVTKKVAFLHFKMRKATDESG
jgi:hypothetical protein